MLAPMESFVQSLWMIAVKAWLIVFYIGDSRFPSGIDMDDMIFQNGKQFLVSSEQNK